MNLDLTRILVAITPADDNNPISTLLNFDNLAFKVIEIDIAKIKTNPTNGLIKINKREETDNIIILDLRFRNA